MKKIVCLILALVMCLFLCACGGKSNSSNQSGATNIFAGDSVVDEIKEQLIGEWYYENKPTSSGIPRYLIAEFNEEGYFTILIVHAHDSGHKVDGTINGTYEVSKKKITAYSLDSKGEVLATHEFEPVYEDGTLSLIHKGLGAECTKGEWLDYLEEHR